MKISFRAFVGAAIVAGLVALPASAQNTPAGAAPKPVAKEPVFNPEPGVAKQNSVNVRGQASMKSEVIGHLQKNDAITILEEITLKKPKQDEPARWFRIALPPQVPVWVHSSFVATTGAVKPRRLNLRGGPGENYSIVGRLERGATVKSVDSKNGWLKIETPTNAFGFVAAHLAEKVPQAIVPVPPATNEITSVPPPVTTVQNTPPPVVAEVTPPTPAVVPDTPVAPPITATPAPAVTPAPAELPPDAPIEKVRKIVSREGILKGSVSIQAPTYFELRSLDTGKTIDYVFSPSTNLLLREFKGQRIIVTGEELLDERWQNTPVIIVDSLQTVP